MSEDTFVICADINHIFVINSHYIMLNKKYVIKVKFVNIICKIIYNM